MGSSVKQDKSNDTQQDFIPQPFLSVIIPAFNEERKLPRTLNELAAFVKSQDYVAEVIVVDNGSTDLTKKVTADFISHNPFIKYLYEGTRGKGAAVKAGVFAAQGHSLFVCDADLSVPIWEVANFLPPKVNNYDVAIGSREIKCARRFNEPLYRHVMGRVFNIAVQLLVLPGIRDTQCGFKCFRRDPARDLFASSSITGWGFDIEILCIARIRGYRIVELPVDWYYGEESKIRPLWDTWGMLSELLRIRKNREKGIYNVREGRS
jgi:dolichyl-phosphate beta-glucosyltransferase